MPRLKLSKTSVANIPHPSAGQVIYRDTSLPGFAVRVGTKSKVYVAEGQVNRRTVRATIGRADVIPAEAARKKALCLLQEMADGKNPNQKTEEDEALKITLAQAFERFFEHKKLAAGTLDGYRRTPKVYLPSWQHKPICKITRQMILKRHQEISQQNGEATANNVMRHFRSIYNFTLATYDSLPPNPVLVLTHARAWNKEHRRHTVIPAHQIGTWYKHVMNETQDGQDFLLVALFTGMRRSEISKLRWEHIDLVGQTLHIPKTKNGDPLDLPLSDYLTDLLKNRRSLTNGSEWVFPGPGKKGHMIEPKKFIKRVNEASGVSFTLHDLRRTYITIAESLDIPAYALKRLLNHRTDRDITGGYIVINSERLRQPVARIAERILDLIEK